MARKNHFFHYLTSGLHTTAMNYVTKRQSDINKAFQAFIKKRRKQKEKKKDKKHKEIQKTETHKHSLFPNFKNFKLKNYLLLHSITINFSPSNHILQTATCYEALHLRKLRNKCFLNCDKQLLLVVPKFHDILSSVAYIDIATFIYLYILFTFHPFFSSS